MRHEQVDDGLPGLTIEVDAGDLGVADWGSASRRRLAPRRSDDDPHVVAGLVSVIDHGVPAMATTDGVRAVLANRPSAENAGAPS